ncbi:MAG: acyl-CoA dehydrogenase [Gemmatimonadaceae bacterium]|nr:acyl-CoA dehydrogenase [Gemmatimonadaceae bacterium]
MTVSMLSSRDLEFQLYEVLAVDTLTSRERYADHSRETFDAVIATARGIAETHLLPHRRESDEQEPFVQDGRVVTPDAVQRGVAAIADAGFIAAAHDYADGGMQLPHVVATAAMLWFDAANVATSSYAMLTTGVANLVRTFGTPAQREQYLEALLTGRAFGTMALTEPDAGSSLADLRTQATPAGAGYPADSYCITGTKMWISGGEHEMSENIVHMVLVRLAGAPEGVRGISLMLVPRYRASATGERIANGVVLGGLIHKMGWRGTTSTILNFGEHTECIGELVGQPHRGLSCMFQMMNEARIGVGRAGTAMAYAAYRHALSYARTRMQGRLAGEKDPLRPPVAIIEHPDVRRMLLAQKSIAEGALSLILECAHLVDEERTATDDTARHTAAALLEMLTPIAKAWPGEAGQEAISLAMQTLGGYGFAREYPIEQYYRDNRLNPIHEGTNGVQALDLLGRKVRQDNGTGFQSLLARMHEVAAATAADQSLAALGMQLSDAATRLERVTAALLVVKAEPARALANASAYLDLVSRTVIAWLWLRQAVVATRALASSTHAADDAFYRGKVQAARYWFGWELPRTVPLADLLERADAIPFDMQDAWF